MRERNVPKSVLFKLISSKKPFGLMGLIFTSIALFIFLPLVISIAYLTREPYESYDFEAIEKSGTTAQGIVTGIDAMTNVSVNGEHPAILSYSYQVEGKTVYDKFQTFEITRVSKIQPGDKIDIKVRNGESAPVGIEPYSFPVYLIMFGPLTFLMVGIIFLLIALIPALKKYKLYKTGIVKEAEIISMAPTGFGVRGMHRQSLLVTYYFTGRNGTKVFGESVTDEYSLLHEKKSGDTIKIFVDRDEESKSCLVPKLEAMKYGWNIQ